jgi:hypothetical protein
MPIPDDDAPTKPADWIGAAEIRPEHKAGYRAPENPMMFFVFRSSTDATLFAVTDRDDASVLPPCPRNGPWTLFKRFAETGQPRVAFSESEAKHEIHERGYHLVKARIEAAASAS